MSAGPYFAGLMSGETPGAGRVVRGRARGSSSGPRAREGCSRVRAVRARASPNLSPSPVDRFIYLPVEEVAAAASRPTPAFASPLVLAANKQEARRRVRTR